LTDWCASVICMFIKRTTKTVNGIPYHNYLLVQSVKTEKGPRHKTVCSLGNLEAGPPKKWREMAQKIESAIAGQLALQPDPVIDRIVRKAREAGVLAVAQEQNSSVNQAIQDTWAKIDTSTVRVDDAAEAGPVHVAHQIWEKLELDEVLEAANLPERAIRLTEIEVINRLVEPGSEHSVRNWVSRTALPDIFREDMPPINDTALYRNLDKLHPERQKIEQTLTEKEITLFNLQPTIFLYDLTSTYFGAPGKLGASSG
jgi:hypothetical protein